MSKKTKKQNSLAILGLDHHGFNSDSSNTSYVTKKSKKGLSKRPVLMEDSFHKPLFLERTVEAGEKRKLELHEESPKKKKTKKSTDSDTSGHSEKLSEYINSFSNSDQNSFVKPSKQGKELENELFSKGFSNKTPKKSSPHKTAKSALKTDGALGSPIVRSPKKAIKEKISTTATIKSKKLVHHEKDVKKSPEKCTVFDHSDEDSQDPAASDEEEEDVDNEIENEDEMSIEESASKSSEVKADHVGWTEEQTQDLFEVMTAKFLIKPDERLSFRQRVKKITWGDIPEILNPPRTADECVQHLDAIFKKVKTMRNLSEMFRAHKVRVQNRSKFHVTQPIQRFRKENGEEIKKLGGNFFSASKQMFDALPEEEKYQRYILPYEKELKETNAKRRTKFATTHSALHFFRVRYPDLSWKDSKLQYAQLSPRKRLRFIRYSYDEFKEAWRAHENLGDSGEGLKAPFCHLTKEEWVILLRSLGMPLIEAKGPKELYMMMNPEHADDVSKSKSYFMNCPDRNKYVAHFLEMRQNFKKSFEEWMVGVEDDLVKKPASAYFEEIMSNKATIRETKKKTPVSKVTSKVRELEESYVESGMIGNFPAEPKAPPMTSKECFIDYTKRTNPGLKQKEINDKFDALEKGLKEKLSVLAKRTADGYKKQLMEFVDDLPAAQKKIYIGQSRIKFIKIFQGVDIFEEEYPCSEYPPFRKRTKAASSKSPATSKILTLDEYFTPLGEEGPSNKKTFHTSTPMHVPTRPTSSSQSVQTPSDEARTGDGIESSSDDDESVPADDIGSFHAKAAAARAGAKSPSSSDVSEDADKQSFHQPSPRRSGASKKKYSGDPLSSSKLNAFLQLTNEKRSPGAVNGATKVSPKTNASNKQKMQKPRADPSSDEESDEDDDDDDDEEETDDEYDQKTKLTQSTVRHTESEDSSEDESEEEVVPAWS